jgi:hypothetical protein
MEASVNPGSRKVASLEKQLNHSELSAAEPGGAATPLARGHPGRSGFDSACVWALAGAMGGFQAAAARMAARRHSWANLRAREDSDGLQYKEDEFGAPLSSIFHPLFGCGSAALLFCALRGWFLRQVNTTAIPKRSRLNSPRVCTTILNAWKVSAARRAPLKLCRVAA